MTEAANELQISGPPDPDPDGKGWVRAMDSGTADDLWNSLGRTGESYTKDADGNWVTYEKHVKSIEIQVTANMLIPRIQSQVGLPVFPQGELTPELADQALKAHVNKLTEGTKEQKDWAYDTVAGLDVLAVHADPDGKDQGVAVELGYTLGEPVAILAINRLQKLDAVRTFPTHEDMVAFREDKLIVGPPGWKGVRAQNLQPGMVFVDEIYSNDIQIPSPTYTVKSVEIYHLADDEFATVTGRPQRKAGDPAVRVQTTDDEVLDYWFDQWMGVQTES